MNWKSRCLSALDAEKMFEDSKHKTRFKELLDCYSDSPFFTKGLCKCMYLSAWDDSHFLIMLETLTSLSLNMETNTKEMRDDGDSLAEAQKDGEYYVYQLSNAFLDNSPFSLNESADIAPEFRYIIERGLRAAEIIDNL